MPLRCVATASSPSWDRTETSTTATARRRRYANNERISQMATKTKAIEVKVDERLAEAISDKAVKAWHATNYSNGRKRVYVTFEEVVSA